MTSWGDEINAAVDSGVWDPFLPVDVNFLLEVCFILVVNKLHDGLPAMFMEKQESQLRKKTPMKIKVFKMLVYLNTH